MKITVIGGGMSGLTAAIALAKKGHKVTLLEANKRIGKKISVTGNGRCNIFNADFDPNKYNDSDLAKKIIKDYSEKVKNFLSEIGLVTGDPDEQGRVYPVTETANSVVDCLRYAAEKNGVNIITECKAEKIIETELGVNVESDKGTYRGDRVVVAVGSNIGVSGYNADNIIDQKFFTRRFPSLTPVKVFNPIPQLNGVRVTAKVSLTKNGEKVFMEQGEVLFKEYGLGGIVILNLSSIIARDMVKGETANYIISLDFFPNYTENELTALLGERLIKYGSDKMFCGLLHNKISEAVLSRIKGPLTKNNIAKAAATLKGFTFKFHSLVDKSMAQVCAGGIDEKFLDGLKLKNTNIYFAGEVLNVDGVCGGYNLYFACASGLFVAETIK